MSSVVVDTHSAIWYLEKSPSLSVSGFKAIDMAARSGGNICVASISLIEVIYLVDKSKLKEEALNKLIEICTDSATGWLLIPVSSPCRFEIGIP